MITEGKLGYTEQARSWYRKIKSNESSTDIQPKKGLTEDEIIEFCNVSRYVYEIKKEFKMDNNKFKKIVGKLIDDGKLINTEKDKGYYRKLLKNG